MLGTLINVVTVATGSTVGLILKDKLPEKLTQIVFQGLGLFTILIGIKLGLESQNGLALVLGLLIGAIVGQLIDLEQRSFKLIERFKKDDSSDHNDSKRFAEGLLTAFVLFCIGSMTLIGCIREGTTGNRDIILTKAIMDLFSSTALAAALGRGVLFSVIPLLAYQGGLTLAAGFLSEYMSDSVTAELNGCGGVLLIALGLNILKITDIKVLNFSPALIFAPLFGYLIPLISLYISNL